MTQSDKPAVIDFFFPPQEKVNIFYFAGRCLVFVMMLWVGIGLMAHMPSSEAAGHSFFHNISLPFHEAGHIFFRLLGDFMGTLGGSIMQVLVPAVCLGAFLKKGDIFASSFALWWTGQNFIDMAPYINDARAGSLMLLGGVTGAEVPGYHDWNNILGDLGILKLDHALANTAHLGGSLLMIAAFAWGAIILYMQGKNLDT
ncbi:MAG: zinc ribbon domain-containing protein [Syntrophorhabdaceae bacterium]